MMQVDHGHDTGADHEQGAGLAFASDDQAHSPDINLHNAMYGTPPSIHADSMGGLPEGPQRSFSASSGTTATEKSPPDNASSRRSPSPALSPVTEAVVQRRLAAGAAHGSAGQGANVPITDLHANLTGSGGTTGTATTSATPASATPGSGGTTGTEGATGSLHRSSAGNSKSDEQPAQLNIFTSAQRAGGVVPSSTDARRLQRREKNRESARRVRERRASQLANFQELNQRLRAENEELRRKLADQEKEKAATSTRILELENQYSMAALEVVYLRNQLSMAMHGSYGNGNTFNHQQITGPGTLPPSMANRGNPASSQLMMLGMGSGVPSTAVVDATAGDAPRYTGARQSDRRNEQPRRNAFDTSPSRDQAKRGRHSRGPHPHDVDEQRRGASYHGVPPDPGRPTIGPQMVQSNAGPGLGMHMPAMPNYVPSAGLEQAYMQHQQWQQWLEQQNPPILRQVAEQQCMPAPLKDDPQLQQLHIEHLLQQQQQLQHQLQQMQQAQRPQTMSYDTRFWPIPNIPAPEYKQQPPGESRGDGPWQ